MRRFPAEWEKQRGMLLCFPHNGNDWPGKYQAVQWAFVEFIKKIATYQMVYLVVAHDTLKNKVAEILAMATVNPANITFIIQKTNRSWMRDSGPIIVKNGKQSEALQFHFNAWAKYPNYQLDRKLPPVVAKKLGLHLTEVMYKGQPVVLEGGALETNGKGTLITTEECLLHPTVQVRNAHLTRTDYEAIFHEYLGITNTIWLGDGIAGDDTHGHIDDLCRFVNAETVVTVVEKDPKHKNYKALQDNLHRLQSARLENGQPLSVVTLPTPKDIVFDGLTLPASYANFLIVNHAILVPTFNDPADREALATLASCFKDREVIGISAIDLIWGFGTLHCLSQQVPA